jgi:hypothetical protein
MRKGLIAVASLAVVLGAVVVAPQSQAAVTFTNKTTANGLGNNLVNGVFANGCTVYAATQGGFSISTDGGGSFTNTTTTNGLGSNTVRGVYAVGSTIYAATGSGLSISGSPSCSGGGGANVPTAPMQAYGRDVNGKCVDNAPIWVNWLGIATQQYVAWSASWQQWPNNGTGGYVCQRQPYFTSGGTWSVQ